MLFHLDKIINKWVILLLIILSIIVFLMYNPSFLADSVMAFTLGIVWLRLGLNLLMVKHRKEL